MSVLFAATLAATVQGSLTVGDRSEARLRTEATNDGTGTKNRFVADIETTPSAVLRVWSRRAEIDLGYAPRYTLRDYTTNPTGEIVQRISAGVGLAPDRRTRVGFGEDFTYGRASFVSLGLGQTSTTTAPPPGAPPVERLPLVLPLNYVVSRAYLTTSIVVTQLLRFGAYADYSYSGGTDATSKTVFPVQITPRGELTMDVTITRRDALVSTVRASRVATDATLVNPPSNIVFLEQLEGIRHAFSRSTDGTVAAGVSETAARIGDDARHWKVYPIGEASLRHALSPDRLEGRAYVRLAPIVDRLTGNLDYQLQGSLVGLWTPGNVRHGMLFRTILGGAQSVPPSKSAALTIVTLEAAVGYRTSEHVLLEVGARAISIRSKGTDPAPLLYMGFVTATFTAERLRF